MIQKLEVTTVISKTFADMLLPVQPDIAHTGSRRLFASLFSLWRLRQCSHSHRMGHTAVSSLDVQVPEESGSTVQEIRRHPETVDLSVEAVSTRKHTVEKSWIATCTGGPVVRYKLDLRQEKCTLLNRGHQTAVPAPPMAFTMTLALKRFGRQE